MNANTFVIASVVLLCQQVAAFPQQIDAESENRRLEAINAVDEIYSRTGYDFYGKSFYGPDGVPQVAERETGFVHPITGASEAVRPGAYGSRVRGNPILSDNLVALTTTHGRSIWDLQLGEEVRRLPIPLENLGGSAAVDGVQIYVDVAVDSADDNSAGEVRWWDLSSGELIGSLQIDRTLAIDSVLASRPESSQIAVSVQSDASSRRIVVCDLANLSVRDIVEWPEEVVELEFGKNGDLFVGSAQHAALLHLSSDMVNRRDLSVTSETLASRFTPDGSHLATTHRNGEVVLWNTYDLQPLRRWTLKESTPDHVDISPDGEQLIVSWPGGYDWKLVFSIILNRRTGKSSFGFPLRKPYFVPGTDLLLGNGGSRAQTARLWSYTTGQPVAQPIVWSSQRFWAIKSRGGEFGASSEMYRFLRGHEGGYYLRNAFYRPDVIKRVLKGVPYDLAKRLGADYEYPAISLRLIRMSNNTAKVGLSMTPKGETVSRARVQLQRLERPFTAEVAKQWQSVPADGVVLDLPFPRGKNEMTITATSTDRYGIQSRPAKLRLRRPTTIEELSGRLFVLSVGVSKHKFSEYDLKFPAKDAGALAEEFAKHEGLAFGEVHSQVYTDQKATLGNLRDGLAWLERVCTTDDVAVVFFAGHGIKGRRGLYYVTHEGDAEAMQYTCLNWEDVAKTLRSVKAKQTIFLSDACYAGGFAKTQLAMQRDLAESLQSIDNLLVFASSGPEEPSLEDDAWGHGAFTVSLLSALKGDSDSNGDGLISLNELVTHTTNATMSLTQTAQTPFVATTGSYDKALAMARLMPNRRESRPATSPLLPGVGELPGPIDIEVAK